MPYLGGFVISTNYIIFKNAEIFPIFFSINTFLWRKLENLFSIFKNIIFIEMEYDKVMCTFVISQFSNQHSKSYCFKFRVIFNFEKKII